MHSEPFTNACNKNGCDIRVGENFLNLESADDFEKFKITSEVLETAPLEKTYNDGVDCTTVPCFGVFAFQMAWKVDDCTIFILEWKQNFNPLRTYIGETSTAIQPLIFLASLDLFSTQFLFFPEKFYLSSSF